MDELDPRAKYFCTLCHRSINPYEYRMMGNFCHSCNAECDRLFHAFPGEMPGDHLPDFQHKLNEWHERKETYIRLSTMFQKELVKSRKSNKIKK